MRRPTPLIVAGAAALALAAVPAPATASKTQFPIFEPTREVLGADDALRKQALDEVKAFGVKRIRVLVIWKNVLRHPNARTRPSFTETDPNAPEYDFSRYDTIFAEAAERGIEIIPTLTGPVPTWATGRHRGHVYKPDRNAFERFVEAVGRRYGDKVGTWTVFNEPNQPQFLMPQFVGGKPYSPLLYRALYQAALQGLGATGNGRDRILAGETSPAGNSNIVAPLTFVRVFFKGKKLDVDGWAHHPYTKKAGPFYKPKPGDVTIGALPRLTKALDRYSHHSRLKLYLTEFGIQSKPDPNYGVSAQRQNEYRAIAEKIAYDNSRVAAFSQYLLRDDLARSGSDKYGGFESGLRYAGGKPKPAFEGYRLPLVARAGTSSTRLWGIARPAPGRTTVRIEYRDHGAWKLVADVATNSRGVWTRKTRKRKGRQYRVKWQDFTGPATRAY
jgi:beta-xylosidase